MNYEEFLKSKHKTVQPSGFDVDISELNPRLFEWQKVTTQWLIRKGKACYFADTGLGKTITELEFADKVSKKTNGKVLIVTFLTVAIQTESESRKFGYNAKLVRNQSECTENGVYITNYEMLEHFSSDGFTGIVLDESSILKSYMGVTKQKIIKEWGDIEYKLSCTATPSPNNQMEILNQAEFLGIMKSHEALAIWFINDTSQSGNYMLKGHAIKSFWEWVSSWAICISKPSEIGFSDEGYILPKLNESEIVIEIDETSEDLEEGFFRKIETNATAFHKEKRLTAELRAMKCAEIVMQDDEQYMIWCSTDYEADLLKKHIPSATEVRGSNKTEFKEQATKDFLSGKIRVLISKTKIFGYGLNFQNCHNCVFCGLDYSYENYYQSVRRFWRFGQKSSVNVFIVIGSTEQHILKTVRNKEKQHSSMKAHMYEQIRDFQDMNVNKKEFSLKIKSEKIPTPSWIKGE